MTVMNELLTRSILENKCFICLILDEGIETVTIDEDEQYWVCDTHAMQKRRKKMRVTKAMKEEIPNCQYECRWCTGVLYDASMFDAEDLYWVATPQMERTKLSAGFFCTNCIRMMPRSLRLKPEISLALVLERDK